ncbi:oxidoreductase-like domain-containing protein [Aquabacterium humicola]|uniref:oxidoreductase-like domain-containing protein n=1 Tax=Aquabacterium humicola TaxID=3237377 RepID=UPI002542B3C4|nr:oxidoreductase-like domain-containing protein [Rubrivivax pictus]
MTAAGPPPDLPPPEPERPDEQACCGNGCEPCVFDLYAEARRRWREDMKAWQQRQAAPAVPPASASASA